MKTGLEKALKNMRKLIEFNINSAIDGDTVLDMDKLFNDLEKYVEYKNKIKMIK